jgi:hypothetical protein
MASYSQGDPVVAVKSFGGFARERIERGARGTVTETSFSGKPTKVMFTSTAPRVGARTLNRRWEPGEAE